MKELSNFRKFNGLLRIIVLILGVISIGLTVSRFRRNEINEIIFLGSCIFATTISFIHFFLSFLIGCNHGGKCFRVGDFVFHLITGLLLLVSSTLMLMIASKKGATLDYRFQDSKHVLARTMAAIFGLQNSGIYLLISYLTITENQFIYCQRLPNRKPKSDKVETGATTSNSREVPPAPSTVASSPDAIPEACGNVEDSSSNTFVSSLRLRCQKYSWRRLVSDDVLETRLLIVILGSVNVGILSHSFQTGNEVEEYFLSITVISLTLHILAQILYALGLIQLEASVIIIADATMQLTSSFLLLLGGALMLGSTIENSYHVDLQNKIIERTLSSVIGILTGVLHLYVGTAVKRSFFSKSLNINPEPSEVAPKPSRNGQKRTRPSLTSESPSSTATNPGRDEQSPAEASCVIA